MVTRYDEGETARLAVNFKDSSSNDVDPGGVTFKIKPPSGTVTTYVYGTDAQLVKDNTGDYHVDYTLNESGDWYYHFEGTTTNKGLKASRIYVEDSKITD